MTGSLWSLSWIHRAVGVTMLTGVAAAMTSHPKQAVAPAPHATLADEGPMPELAGAVAWLNSPPLTRESLRGKVVLVNFWTYSCINSLRELPYVRAWAAKYKDAGLVVIGVHAPEFGFEKDRANVERAVRELNIAFPVPVDNDHAVWRAFRNEAWPADYFIDKNGRIRHHHFGEGEYDQSESVIRQLLEENGATGLDADPVRVSADGAEAPPSLDVQSPETYLGYARTEHFASPERMAHDTPQKYTLPAASPINRWALGGVWNVGAESAQLREGRGTISFRFHSRDLHMVLSPAADGKPVRFKVRVDDAPPGDDHGVDSKADGAGEVNQPRMYQLIRQRGPVRTRTFEIEFLDPGVQGFSFTFG